MLVIDPLPESIDVFPHPFVVGVEQMSSIQRYSNGRLVVDVIVAIAANVRSFLNDETGLIERCVLLCDCGAAESRSDYAVVVGAIECVVVVLHVGGRAEKMIGARRTKGRGGSVAREHVQPDRGCDDNECDEGTYWGEETARAIFWAVMDRCLASALYGGRHCSFGVVLLY